MGKIQNLVDYHTHNGYYRGTQEVWSLQEGWEQAQTTGLKRLGISNKIEFNHPKQDFVPLLRRELDELENSAVLLGVELDFGDMEGTNVMKESTLELVDFVIGAPHNHPVYSLLFPDIEEEEIEEHFAVLRNILYNSLKNCPVDIWGHPFLQELNFTGNKYRSYIVPMFHELCELCANQNIAFEINSNYFRITTPKKKVAHYWNTSREYYDEKMDLLSELCTIALNNYDLKFSFASDSHQLRDVGQIEKCVEFAVSIGITDENILLLEPKKG